MARILVTDGEQRSALAIVRSLGGAGHPVRVVASRPRPLAGSSRHCGDVRVAPDPLGDPTAFVEAVRGAAVDCALVVPVTEAAALALLPAREALPPMPLPPEAAFRSIHDKARVARAAEACGIGVPRQLVVAGPDTAVPDEWLDRAGSVVIKPARSVVADANGASKHGVSYVASGRELPARLDALPAGAFPVLLQERIVGAGVGVFLLRWAGEVRAVFGHERIREKPPSGGVSVLRRSVDVPADLADRCRRLLEAFDWEGVAMVELKLDEASGTPYIMEVNGRFWGSLQLAIDAGVDFPALLVHYALGGAPLPLPGYRSGVTTRWLWGDVDHLLAVLRRRGLPPGEEGSFGRIAAVGRFLAAFRPGVRSEVWRPGDPAPFLRESLDWLRGR